MLQINTETLSTMLQHFLKQEINKYMSNKPCPECKGARLRPESLAVKIEGLSIYELTRLSVSRAFEFFNSLALSEKEKLIARQILKEIKQINLLISFSSTDF